MIVESTALERPTPIPSPIPNPAKPTTGPPKANPNPAVAMAVPLRKRREKGEASEGPSQASLASFNNVFHKEDLLCFSAVV